MATIVPKATFLKTTLLTSHVIGDGALVLQTGDGAILGTLGADQIFAVTAVLNPGLTETIVGNFVATGISGDTLTGVTGDALGTDVGVAALTPIQVRITPAWLGALQGAVHDLESVPEVSVTGATTLTAAATGKMIVVSGSSSFALTFPSAVGLGGTPIGVRCDAAYSGLVTLTGASGQTFAGIAGLAMHAKESAVWKSDGANWVRVGGSGPIPMVCTLAIAAAIPITANTFEFLVFDSAPTDPSGLMADLANNRIVIPRDSLYRVSAGTYVGNNDISDGSNLLLGIWRNSVDLGFKTSIYASAGSANLGLGNFQPFQPMTAGDAIQAFVILFSSIASTIGLGNLEVTEMPTW